MMRVQRRRLRGVRTHRSGVDLTEMDGSSARPLPVHFFSHPILHSSSRRHLRTDRPFADAPVRVRPPPAPSTATSHAYPSSSAPGSSSSSSSSSPSSSPSPTVTSGSGGPTRDYVEVSSDDDEEKEEEKKMMDIDPARQGYRRLYRLNSSEEEE